MVAIFLEVTAEGEVAGDSYDLRRALARVLDQERYANTSYIIRPLPLMYQPAFLRAERLVVLRKLIM